MEIKTFHNSTFFESVNSASVVSLESTHVTSSDKHQGFRH